MIADANHDASIDAWIETYKFSITHIDWIRLSIRAIRLAACIAALILPRKPPAPAPPRRAAALLPRLQPRIPKRTGARLLPRARRCLGTNLPVEGQRWGLLRPLRAATVVRLGAPPRALGHRCHRVGARRRLQQRPEGLRGVSWFHEARRDLPQGPRSLFGRARVAALWL